MKKQLPPLALALRRARGKAGISQYELARQSGVARITIANIELGKSGSIRTLTAEKLARSLGLTTWEFMAEGQSAPTTAEMQTIDEALSRYQASKAGTVMVAKTREVRWLRQILSQWGEDGLPSDTSILFLLLAYRHRSEL